MRINTVDFGIMTDLPGTLLQPMPENDREDQPMNLPSIFIHADRHITEPDPISGCNDRYITLIPKIGNGVWLNRRMSALLAAIVIDLVIVESSDPNEENIDFHSLATARETLKAIAKMSDIPSMQE